MWQPACSARDVNDPAERGEVVRCDDCIGLPAGVAAHRVIEDGPVRRVRGKVLEKLRSVDPFDTDRIAEWDAIVDRWAAAIGAQRAARWSVLGADRDLPGRHVAVVEFPGYAEAMANSGHPATAAFLKELKSICTSEPQFHNLDVRSARTY
jgi:hypothetical protein